MTETKFRSVLKSISWRMMASILTGIIVFTFTERHFLALGVAFTDSAIKIMALFS